MRDDVERTRAALGLGVLVGLLIAGAAVWPLLASRLEARTLFVVTGVVVMLTVALSTWSRVGAERALALGLLSGVATTVVTYAAAFGACVLTGCVR